MTREQIGKALEYSDSKQLEKLHGNNRNTLDALSVEISRFGKAPLSEGVLPNIENKPFSKLHPDTLLYNEDGIYEITFLSRQPRANEFRAWVRERIKEIRKGTIRIQC